MKIIGVVDLILSTVNGSVKHDVFKYHIPFKNEEDPDKPRVSFALGLDNLGCCKLPSEHEKTDFWMCYYQWVTVYPT